MGRELFDGDAARLLLVGNALHADIPIEAPGSGLMGFLMTMLAQDCGFPVPVGGAGSLTAALVKRASCAGASIQCSSPVEAIEVRGDRALAVRTSGGSTVRVRRAVIADVGAPDLYQRLLPRTCRACQAARGFETLCVGHASGEGQLRARRADPVAVGQLTGDGHRAPRRPIPMGSFVGWPT